MPVAKRFRCLTRLRKDCRGQVLMMAALLFPTLLTVIGLSLDGGYVYQLKRRMQTAADAAALGAAQELWRNNSSRVDAEARNDAQLNGFSDGDSTITVNYPPTSGPHTDDPKFVEVIIEREAPTYFLRIINRQSSTVKSRAVAGLVNYADGCIMTLDPDQRGALTVSGAAELRADCGVMVNSDDNRAILVDGGGCIYAGEVGVAGGYVTNGSANCIVTPTGQISTNVLPALDPLDYLTPPSILSTTNVVVGFNNSGGDITIQPGRYVGGIQISGGTVNFEPGVYILDGGGLRVTGNAILNGPGVMFYNTNTVGTMNLWGDFDIAGTVIARLSAPTSGDYKGILFWNDKNAPDSNPGSVIAGASDSVYEGALYFPSTHVTYTGTSDSANWTMIIADTLTVSGTSYVNSDYATSNVPPPTRKATLVE